MKTITILLILWTNICLASVGDTINGWLQTYDGCDTDKYTLVVFDTIPMGEKTTRIQNDSVAVTHIDTSVLQIEHKTGYYVECGDIYEFDSTRRFGHGFSYDPKYKCDPIYFEIIGDTSCAIKKLICIIHQRDEYIAKLYSRINKLEKIIKLGVDWGNSVPDIYETGNLFNKYLKGLKSIDYVRVSQSIK